MSNPLEELKQEFYERTEKLQAHIAEQHAEIERLEVLVKKYQCGVETKNEELRSNL